MVETVVAPAAGISPRLPFWTFPEPELLQSLQCNKDGLTTAVAKRRLAQYGANSDVQAKSDSLLRDILRRLLEPLSLMLLAAGIVSIATGDIIGGLIIVAILSVSIGLDTFQEGHAAKAADVLRKSVALKAEVKRNGAFEQVDVEQVVPGDIVRVRAGDIIPGDGLIIEAAAFTANEAALTGEPYPVEKRLGPVSGTTAGEASNALFRGSVAQTGEAIALVVGTGANTIFGKAAASLAQDVTPSPFQRDLRQYGLVVARLTLVLVVLVLTARILLGEPLLGSLLFSVALAVGLTPELLPMITTVTLSRGAMRMASRKVIVKRLASIHDLGAMSVLCTDKTGTLTSAEIKLAKSLDPGGSDDPRAGRLAAIGAFLGGDRGSLDTALMEGTPEAASGWLLLGRHTFDFSRRSGSVLVDGPEGRLLIVKGAPEAVVQLCSRQRIGRETAPSTNETRAAAMVRIRSLAESGLRAIVVASRPWQGAARNVETTDETDLVFEGICAFADPPKATAAAAIARLAKAGITLKILSGDDPVVVKHLAGLVGLRAETVLSGADIAEMSDDALTVQVRSIDSFGRLAPDQKSRIVRALQARGSIVGFLGDGINDAPALRTADIGLSVAGATGVAQATADMILLASDLGVIADGVEEGRRTFANILKYIRMGASSNFGNMLSMAVAAIVLPFLPMLPVQILLNNLLYDLSEIGIPFDSVRPEGVARPQIWDMKGLLRFAAIMGPLSSLFDFLTFGGLIWILRATPEEFQTTWFLESMATQILVIFLIRTNGRPWKDKPHVTLTITALLALFAAMAIPFTPVGTWFGFVAPSAPALIMIFSIVVTYLIAVELVKPWAIKTSHWLIEKRGAHHNRVNSR
ncbi:magnesium-translocating P-type ATPase [Rhizobium sp. PL01]|uniref:magnesium-translocating P-type ATPase n=1 Tax=Rhizobium sp. PL01 TaxID=3085631 RepID=UPI002981E844|nr:magnesium-translocating P-type ATPase [Rhizobium sp. PL01]MDW5317508.1 magnesium-translocating P-type ATPase [Rhizobium sp. PL01]